MAIMQSCCCWRSVRRGSFACAIYTAFYYSVMMIMIAAVLQEESQYLSGNRSRPKSNSVLEQEVSPMTLRFNIALLVCSSCGVVCCLLLLYGLFKDEKLFLVPWICIVPICSLVDIAHLIYLLSVSLPFNPITAMVLTLDFFVLCLNTYSVLCVLSQYQEYSAGRGTASDDCEPGMTRSVRYRAQPTATATSCLSYRRTATNNETTRGASATPTQSPTTILDQLTGERGLDSSCTEKIGTSLTGQRKHVQFPDPPVVRATDEVITIDDKANETIVAELRIIKNNNEDRNPIKNYHHHYFFYSSHQNFSKIQF